MAVAEALPEVDVVVPDVPNEWLPLIPVNHKLFVLQRFGAMRSTALVCVCGNKIEVRKDEGAPTLEHWQGLIKACLVTAGKIEIKDQIDWPVVQGWVSPEQKKSEEPVIPLKPEPEKKRGPGRPRKAVADAT